MDLAVLAARFDDGAVALVARKTLYMRLVMVHPDYDVVVRHWRLPPFRVSQACRPAGHVLMIV